MASQTTETWSIVKFVDYSTVAAVPSKWITNNICLWPPFPPEKVAGAIKSQKFDTCWPSHRVEVFRNAVYDSYEIARQKAKKAEDTSDLSTDTEQSRRKIIKKRLSYTSSSNSDNESYANQNKYIQDKNKPQMPVLLGSQHQEESENESNKTLTPVLQTNNKNIELDNLEAMSGTNSTSKCQCYCSHHAQLNGEILRQLYFLRSITTELISEVKQLKIGDELNEMFGISVLANFNLPLATEEELLDFDNFLKNVENSKKVEHELSRWGGSNLLDFIRRCMGNLIANQLAVGFSWLGKRNKKKFCHYEVAKVVISMKYIL